MNLRPLPMHICSFDLARSVFVVVAQAAKVVFTRLAFRISHIADRRRLPYCVALFATASLCLNAHAESRNWRLSGGYSFTGELVSHTDKQVVVLRNGTRYNYPLSAFCKEDQEYISKAPSVTEKTAALPSNDLKRAEMRTWTDIRGNQVTALFVGLADGKISLRTSDGHVHNFPLSEFTAEDQELARKMLPSAPASVTQPPSTPTTKGTVGKPGMLRFELQGYEVSQDTAASIFIAQPDDFDPRAMLTTTAALVGNRKAKLVQLPLIEAFSGARAVATPVGGYSLNAQLTLGRDNRTVQAVYILRRASDQAGSATEAVTRIDDVAFLGSLPGTAADNVMLVFCRISQL